MQLKTFRVFALAISVLSALPTFGWSIKEHIFLTRFPADMLSADPSTPPAIKDWLVKANRQNFSAEEDDEWFLNQHAGLFPHNCDGLGYWGCMPALAKGTGQRAEDINPFGVPKSKLHFTDLELFNPNPAKHTFKEDLSHKPKLKATIVLTVS